MSGGVQWYDIDGNPVDIATADRLLADREARRIGLTQIDEHVAVSTVHLVLDHGFMPDQPPLIFETMIFVDGTGDECVRTSTKHAALAMHDQIVAELRDKAKRR
jgi:hypothetical protein